MVINLVRNGPAITSLVELMHAAERQEDRSHAGAWEREFSGWPCISSRNRQVLSASFPRASPPGPTDALGILRETGRITSAPAMAAREVHRCPRQQMVNSRGVGIRTIEVPRRLHSGRCSGCCMDHSERRQLVGPAREISPGERCDKV